MFHFANAKIIRFTDLIEEKKCDSQLSFAQFKKCEKHPWRSEFNYTKSKTRSWMFFTFFEIVQIVPNRAKCLI